VRTCDARYGDVTCDRAPGHTGMHCGSVTARWYDREALPDDDDELATLRAIVRELVKTGEEARHNRHHRHCNNETGCHPHCDVAEAADRFYAALDRAREYVAKGGAEG
jgi:hypothetical protein